MRAESGNIMKAVWSFKEDTRAYNSEAGWLASREDWHRVMTFIFSIPLDFAIEYRMKRWWTQPFP